MPITNDHPPMTAEQLLALPDDDGVERELLRGQLKERPMTRRNRLHSGASTHIAQVLSNWLVGRPEPRGEVLTGEAGFRLRRNPDTLVGIDVAYISAETAEANPLDAAVIDGAPVLAVEILSPSDKQEDILDKVQAYLDAGVKLVWIVEPRFRTVTVYRAESAPAMFTGNDVLPASDDLPGLRVTADALFGRASAP